MNESWRKKRRVTILKSSRETKLKGDIE